MMSESNGGIEILVWRKN